MKLSELIKELGDIDIDLTALTKLDTPERPISPELKKIDMSACIESGIDCEFAMDGKKDVTTIRSLRSINLELKLPYIDDLYREWKYCRPRMNGHIHVSPDGWDKCPIPDGFIIQYWDKVGNSIECITVNNEWSKDIIMFQITCIAEGYTL